MQHIAACAALPCRPVDATVLPFYTALGQNGASSITASCQREKRSRVRDSGCRRWQVIVAKTLRGCGGTLLLL